MCHRTCTYMYGFLPVLDKLEKFSPGLCRFVYSIYKSYVHNK